MKSLLLIGPSLTPPQQGARALSMTAQEVDRGQPCSRLSLWGCGWVFGWSWVVIVEKFCLIRLSFCWSFGWREQSLLLFFVCLLVCLFVFSGCQIFHSKPGIHRVKGKARELTSVLLLRFQCPYLVCLFSPPFRAFFVVVVYLLTRVFRVLNEAIGKSISIPSSWR